MNLLLSASLAGLLLNTAAGRLTFLLMRLAACDSTIGTSWITFLPSLSIQLNYDNEYIQILIHD